MVIFINYYVVFCLCYLFQIKRKQQLLLCIVINEFPSMLFFWWSGCALLSWARLRPLFSPFQICCRRTVHIHKSHSEINTAILAFCLCNSQCILTEVWVIIKRDNYPQRELKVSTLSRLVTHLSSLVISSCLQTDISQKEYLQGVYNPSAYTNSFITPIFLLGIHFCWFVFDLGAIIKIPNHTTCRLLHIETRKDNSIKRFSWTPRAFT